MNQYPGMPPVGPVYTTHPPRRQDPNYASSPHPHYVPFYAPSSPHPGQIPYGAPPQFIPQWYPYQQYPYPAPPQPRQYSQQSPLVVSSTTSQSVYPFHRAQQHSHQPPPPPVRTPLADQSTPSTASHPVASPSTTPITTSDTTATPPIQPSKAESHTANSIEPQERKYFSLQLPWHSVPESTFPSRVTRRRRKRRTLDLLDNAVSLPSFPRQRSAAQQSSLKSVSKTTAPSPQRQLEIASSASTPIPSHQPAEAAHQPAPTPQTTTLPDASTPQPQRKRAPTRPVIPAIPNIPRRPGIGVTSPPSTLNNQHSSNDETQQPSEREVKRTETDSLGETAQNANSADHVPISPKRAPPKSWAELLRSKNSAGAGPQIPSTVTNGAGQATIKAATADTPSDALRSYEVNHAEKIFFLEPRGLVNTGNMCYMNSILQVLVFCVPFFELLDQVRKRAVHSFKSDTPLLEAIIMFMNEFNVIDSAPSIEQLRLRLKDNELEQYGDSFIPEYVYNAIKQIPRFSSMRRGQQQDAEEFLGLLLEVLHLECMSVLNKGGSNSSGQGLPNGVDQNSTNDTPSGPEANGADGWMEVQRHQRPAVTRSSGSSTSSPITKIFGGSLRSEFRVPGSKNSVTLTPYQQLQLDINDPAVTNIVQALKGLAKSERIDGQFATPRGTASHGVKQLFIEELPPILILHLKRFHYDNNIEATQKIWKKVGYPLDLEIPKEAFTATQQRKYAVQPPGLPKYKLAAVVYHHGKYAGGGHYTVDVRRQEGREWVRLDDTVIRRVRAEDVANEGGEEDPKILAAALERHKKEQQKQASGRTSNPYVLDEASDEAQLADGDGNDGDGWSQVNSNGVVSPPGSSAGNKKWSGVLSNGTAGTSSGGTATPTGKQTPKSSKAAATNGKGVQTSVKDRVAYILFYERVQ